MTVAHPAELTLDIIQEMTRPTLIEQLIAFNEHSTLRFRHEILSALPNEMLRSLLYAARRFYQTRGY